MPEPAETTETISPENPTLGPVRSGRRRPKLDEMLAEAVETARQALLESVDPAELGDHVSATADDDRVVTHRFVAHVRGYRGWEWFCTLARAPRSKTVTVCELGMLPGEGALLSPPWVPWSERASEEERVRLRAIAEGQDPEKALAEFRGETDEPADDDPSDAGTADTGTTETADAASESSDSAEKQGKQISSDKKNSKSPKNGKNTKSDKNPKGNKNKKNKNSKTDGDEKADPAETAVESADVADESDDAEKAARKAAKAAKKKAAKKKAKKEADKAKKAEKAAKAEAAEKAEQAAPAVAE